MTYYSGAFYSYMRDERIKAGVRCVKNCALNKDYAQIQLDNWLYYKRLMKNFRRRIRAQ